MKTLVISLLILSHAWGSKPEISRPAPGGFSVLAINSGLSSISWKAEKTTGSHLGTVRVQSGNLTMRCGQLDKGTVLINMGSLEVTDLSAPDKQKLENNLKGRNFFETDKFPTARLEIVSVDHRSEKVNHFVTILSNLTSTALPNRSFLPPMSPKVIGPILPRRPTLLSIVRTSISRQIILSTTPLLATIFACMYRYRQVNLRGN